MRHFLFQVILFNLFFTMIGLGVWHAYVQGYRVIFQTWTNLFLGQLCFFLFPSMKLFKKPKHMVIFFCFFRCFILLLVFTNIIYLVSSGMVRN